MNQYLYLFLNLASISYPLLKTWDTRVDMWKNRKAIWSSTLIVALVFIAWDIWFTSLNYWGFNPEYLLGVNLVNLPIEEVLFFLCIPYACVFIYEAVKYYDTKNLFAKAGKIINASFILAAVILLIMGYDRWYTALTSALLIPLLLAHQFAGAKNAHYLGRFYLSYIFVLIPFFIVNGVLTGSFIEGEVVWYNNDENLGIRLGTIPLEDVFYNLLMLLSIITLYHYFTDKPKSAAHGNG